MEALDFEKFYSRYEGLVRATLRHYGVRPADLDDLVQDAFVTIHRKLPEFEGRSSIETWVHSVCWRIAVNYRRRAHVRFETELTAEGPAGAPPPEAEMLVGDRLRTAIEELPDRQRDLLTLADIGGLSISALAALTRTTRKTASDGLKRARIALSRGIAPVRMEGESEVHGAGAEGSGPSDSGVLTETDDATDYIDDEICICTRGRNSFVLLRGRANVFRHRILTKALVKLKERYGHGLNYLCVVENTSTPPDRATRKLNAELLAMLGDSFTASVFVVEREPEATLVPAFMNVAAFLSRSPTAYRYFKALPSAAAWLAPLCEGETAASLIAQMDGMRKRLDERRRY
jgi:RNA polymerase sigma-70 factor, ECF subfamily